MAGFGPIVQPNVGAGAIYAADPRLQKAQAERARMEESAQAFEAQYVFQLLELMAPKVGEGGLEGAGFAEETFRPQLHEALAKEVVRQGGFGIAEQVLNELIVAQERNQSAAAQDVTNPETTNEE